MKIIKNVEAVERERERVHILEDNKIINTKQIEPSSICVFLM